MDLTFSAEERAFEQEVRDFIARNLPAEMKHAQSLTPSVPGAATFTSRSVTMMIGSARSPPGSARNARQTAGPSMPGR